MHEAGIVRNVLTEVEEAAMELGIARVREIRLVLGEARAVLPEALQSAFAAFVADTIFEECVLSVEHRNLVLKCMDCGHGFESRLPAGSCPLCKSERTKIERGNELYIDYFDYPEEDV